MNVRDTFVDMPNERVIIINELKLFYPKRILGTDIMKDKSQNWYDGHIQQRKTVNSLVKEKNEVSLL